MSDNVKDSSIWVHPTTVKAIHGQDNRLCIGIVREVRNITKTNELRYMVEVYHKNDKMLISCRMMRQFGGVFNYEDYVMQGYNHNAQTNNQNGTLAIAGDCVLVGKIGGNGREGVILGSMTHPARKSFLDSTKGPQYKSEFNGIETYINEDGEWTLTFKGQPTNLSTLGATPHNPVATPQYDTNVGTSYMKWDKEGSFTLSDEATDGDGLQKLFIDKKNGTIDIYSGLINLNLKKDGQKVGLKCLETLITSDDKITYKTTNLEGEATTKAHTKTPLYVVESPRVRLGEEGASEWLILGSTFRQQQKTMDNTVSAQLTAASIALATAMAQVTAAAVAITASSVIPSIPGIPPVALAPAGVALTAAAVALGQAGVALGSASTAITAFETSGIPTDYLSQVSKTK